MAILCVLEKESNTGSCMKSPSVALHLGVCDGVSGIWQKLAKLSKLTGDLA